MEAVRRILKRSQQSGDTASSSSSSVPAHGHGHGHGHVSVSAHGHSHGHITVSSDLQRSAEEILSGVRRPTGVETTVTSAPDEEESVSSQHCYEVMVQHQDAALTLSSLEQVRYKKSKYNSITIY